MEQQNAPKEDVSLSYSNKGESRQIKVSHQNREIKLSLDHQQDCYSRSSWALMDWDVISHDDEATTKIIGREKTLSVSRSGRLDFNQFVRHPKERKGALATLA